MRMIWQKLVLCNAFLLVLPQGWCCVLPMQAGETLAPVPEAKSCCHAKTAQPKTPAQQEEPVRPVPSCCCEADYAAPEVAKVASPEYFALLSWALVDIDVIATPAVAANAAELPIFIPPLRLLHCLWLC